MAKRKGKWKERFKFIIPIFMLLIGVAFIFVWEFYIKDKVNNVEVVLASNDIGFKDKITRDDLVIENVKRDRVVEGSFRPDEMDYILEKFASIEIKKGTQIYPELIDSYNLVPDETKGEFIAPIPDEWIFAVAGSLRRAYIADFYLVGGDEQAMLESLIEDSKEYEGQVSQSEDEVNDEESSDNDEENEESSNETIVVTDEKTEEIMKQQYEPLLSNIRISSVKDSGNSEVRQSQENPESATGNVSNIEIIATQEVLKTLQEKMNQGYQLYIVHKFEMSVDDKEIDDEEKNEVESEE